MSTATPPDDPAVIGLAAILVDDAADVATIQAIAPGVAVMTFDDVLDDDEALAALEAADVIALVPGDAGPALLARVNDAIRKARTMTDHHKARAVVIEPWKVGTPFPLPQGIHTPGSFIAWARERPPLEAPPTPPHQGNGKAPAATPAVDDDAPMDVPDWPKPPVDDRPEDSPVAWFACMCLAIERGDFQRAAGAQRELERLGWIVRHKAPRRPRTAPRREGGR